MDGKIEEADSISGLPPFILHKILSYLPPEDSARTAELSKRWNSVWNSYPIFEFHQSTYIKEYDRYDETLCKFLKFVDKSLQKFNRNELRMEKLDLDMLIVDPNFVPMINTWLPLALNNGASDIYFNVSPLYRGPPEDYYPLPETTFKTIRSSKFYHLKKLNLSSVDISQNIIQDIIQNCPNICHLVLWFFRGMKTLEISKLDKLETLKIGLRREIECVSVDAPSLKHFVFISYEKNLPCVINLASCYNLKSMHLSNCSITDELLHSFLSKFSLLEDVKLKQCHMLRRIRISGHRLKSLELSNDEIEAIEIDAPNLSKFNFGTKKIMPVLFSENVTRFTMNVDYTFTTAHGRIGSFWFLKLREFLGVSAQSINLKVTFVHNKVCLILWVCDYFLLLLLYLFALHLFSSDILLF